MKYIVRTLFFIPVFAMMIITSIIHIMAGAIDWIAYGGQLVVYNKLLNNADIAKLIEDLKKRTDINNVP